MEYTKQKKVPETGTFSMVRVEITDSAVGDHIPSRYGHIIICAFLPILNTLCHFFTLVQFPA